MICRIDNEMVFILAILTIALLFWFCVFFADWSRSSWKRRIEGIVMFLSFVCMAALGAVIVTALRSCSGHHEHHDIHDPYYP